MPPGQTRFFAKAKNARHDPRLGETMAVLSAAGVRFIDKAGTSHYPNSATTAWVVLQAKPRRRLLLRPRHSPFCRPWSQLCCWSHICCGSSAVGAPALALRLVRISKECAVFGAVHDMQQDTNAWSSTSAQGGLQVSRSLQWAGGTNVRVRCSSRVNLQLMVMEIEMTVNESTREVTIAQERRRRRRRTIRRRRR